jgi:hypothetical protein
VSISFFKYSRCELSFLTLKHSLLSLIFICKLVSQVSSWILFWPWAFTQTPQRDGRRSWGRVDRALPRTGFLGKWQHCDVTVTAGPAGRPLSAHSTWTQGNSFILFKSCTFVLEISALVSGCTWRLWCLSAFLFAPFRWAHFSRTATCSPRRSLPGYCDDPRWTDHCFSWWYLALIFKRVSLILVWQRLWDR